MGGGVEQLGGGDPVGLSPVGWSSVTRRSVGDDFYDRTLSRVSTKDLSLPIFELVFSLVCSCFYA
jgi:hypothetical protein